MRRYLLLVLLLLFSAVSSVLAQEDSASCTTNCTEAAEASPDYGLSAEEIASYELPVFRTLTVDTNLLRDRRYMQVTGAISIHDAPNGNVIRTLDDGFNFLTVINQQDGWIEVNPGEWVSSAYVKDTNYIVSHFTGIFLPAQPLEYTPAWLLINLYPSKEPGGNPVESSGLHYRYTRVTIFSEAYDAEGWRWYQIGPDQWVHQTHLSKVQPIDRPEEVETDRWIGIDLYEQSLIVYENNQPIFATLVATGLPRWPTFEGTFNIYYRRTRHDMSWGTPGDDFYYLEEVPWTMFFDEGRAIHGAYWHDGFGYRRSHGCVNLSITDAYWLYHWIAEDFDKLNSPNVEEGPAVYVYSSDTYR